MPNRTARPTPTSERPDLVGAGRLGAVSGVRGELSCVPTRVGEDAIVAGARLVLDEPVIGRGVVVVASVRRHRGRLFVTFDGVKSADDARPFVGRSVLIARDDVVLREGEYLDDDLIGLTLVDESGTAVGKVSGVRHFPAQDCLVVGARGALVPMVREFIGKIDPAQGRIVVTLPDGLLDDSLAEKA
jgi:16S rRNA processing protein RimM